MDSSSEQHFPLNKRFPHDSIVIAVDKHGKLQFINNNGEELTGYTRESIFKKSIEKILLPPQYQVHWETILESLNNGEELDGFILPLLTIHGEELLISWSELLEGKSANSKGKAFYFIGKPMHTQKKRTIPIPSKNDTIIDGQSPPEIDKKPRKKNHSFKPKLPKLNLKKRDDLQSTNQEKQNHQIKDNQKDNPNVQELTKTLQSLSKNQDRLLKKIQTIQSKEKHLDSITQEIHHHVNEIDDKITQEPKPQRIQSDHGTMKFSLKKEAQDKSKLNRPLISFGSSRKQAELDKKVQQVEEQKRLLAHFETQLLQERKRLAETKESYLQWKEKLLQLECEIEKRRKDLLLEEEHFRDKLKNEQLLQKHRQEIQPKTNDDYHSLLDKISDCAFVLQRGVVRQVNEPLIQLLGYPSDEIIDKRFYDLVDPSNLSDLEQYHLNRLKGIATPIINTTLFTKDRSKVSVEINMKPTNFNNERADIAVIKTIIHNEDNRDEESSEHILDDESQSIEHQEIRQTEDPDIDTEQDKNPGSVSNVSETNDQQEQIDSSNEDKNIESNSESPDAPSAEVGNEHSEKEMSEGSSLSEHVEETTTEQPRINTIDETPQDAESVTDAKKSDETQSMNEDQVSSETETRSVENPKPEESTSSTETDTQQLQESKEDEVKNENPKETTEEETIEEKKETEKKEE